MSAFTVPDSLNGGFPLTLLHLSPCLPSLFYSKGILNVTQLNYIINIRNHKENRHVIYASAEKIRAKVLW
jgi:hypothetical protein